MEKEKNNLETSKPVKKEKMNIWLFAVLMFIAFVGTFFAVHMFFSSFFFYNLLENIYTYDIIGEAILAILAFLVLLFWRNSYVFTQKQEKFIPSLKYGFFYILLGAFFAFIFGVNSLDNIPGIINVALFAFLVGIYEEFLCRGWLLNEFLERYGNTKKGVWISIIASGVIFGLIHFINISSQGFASTFTQVLSASATGILFGLIYYRTKNIWTVVFLHGFWDFSLFLTDLLPTTELTTAVTTVSNISIIASVLIMLSELITLIPFIKDIDAKIETKKLLKYAGISIGAFLFSFFINAIGVLGDKTETYEIGNLSIKEYAITRNNYETYDIKEEIQVADPNGEYIPGADGEYLTKKYSFSLYKTDSMLVFKNNNTNKDIKLEFEELYDYGLFEFETYYLLAYVDLDKDSNVFLRYHYLNKEELSDEDLYLEKVKNNGLKYLIADVGSLCVIHDKETSLDYVGVETDNTGTFVLTEENSVSILNRD